jgi:hypothetical protein
MEKPNFSWFSYLTQGNGEILTQMEHSDPFKVSQAAENSINEEKRIRNLINQ